MSSKVLSPVTHVIFDLDGLLLDTETLYTKIIQNVASEYGKEYTWDLKVKCMGMKTDVAAQLIIDGLHLPLSLSQYLEKFEQNQVKFMPTASILPGAEKLIRHLTLHNVPIAIATGCARESFELKTTNHQEFISAFHHRVFASSDPEVKSGKPNPDIFLVCARRFPDNPNPDKCLVFEDAPNGVTAAVAAGMQVVMVPDSRLDRKLTQGASLVINSLEEFKPELFGLAPFVS